MKKSLLFLLCFISLLLTIGIASAGMVESLYRGPNVCQDPNADIFIGFEDGTDEGVITNQYPGVVFSGPAAGSSWVYEPVADNTPSYWGNGVFFAYVSGASTSGATGRIDVPTGASYVSVLVTNAISPVTIEAYDVLNNPVDTAGPSSINFGTQTMDQLTVSGNGISYVLIHDSGAYWAIDDVCIGIGPQPISTPEFPSTFLPASMIIGFLGAVLLIQRTREQ